MVLTVTMLSVAACGSDQHDTLARARELGVIRAAYAPEPPYAYRDTSGRVTGQSPELLRDVMRHAGVAQVDFVQTEFALLIPMLRSGRVDVIAAGMFITPARQELVDFSDPTLVIHEALVVPSGNPRHLTNFTDVARDSSVRIAALAGSAEEAALERHVIPASQRLVVPDLRTAQAAFTARRVDAIAISEPTARRVASAVGAEVVAIDTERDYPAFAVRQGDRPLLDAIDTALARVINTPGYERLLRRFGFTASDAPPLGRQTRAITPATTP